MTFTPTIGTTYANSIDGLLNPSPSGDYASVFSAFDLSGTCTYNANLFGGGGALLDFSGVVQGDAQPFGTAVAITPRHVLCTEHGSPDANRTMRFVAGDVVSRNPVVIAGVSPKTFVGDPNEASPADVTSFRVYYLTADLPSNVAIYPILADRAANLIGCAVIKGSQDRKLFIADISENDSSLGTIQPANATRQIYHQAVRGGDSGSVVFVLVGTQLIYATNETTSATPDGCGPSVSMCIGQILKACRDLDTDGTGYLPTLWGVANMAAQRGAYYRSDAA